MAGKKGNPKPKAAPGGAKTEKEAPAFDWKPTLACIATYRVLEDNDKLDQFEESDLPFADAADHLLSDLRYFPKTTNNADIIELVAFEVGRKFLTLVIRNFTVSKESDQISSAAILRSLGREFRSSTATFKSLAKTLDENIRFSDEVPQ